MATVGKRQQLELLIRDFLAQMGADWEKYHEALTLFLIGKLLREELVGTIAPLLKNGLAHFHNKFLLLNYANALLDTPGEFNSDLAAFWNRRNAKPKAVRSSQYERFKQNIMGLPLKERRRIRQITRDSGRKGKVTTTYALTRHALLPKVPMIQDKEQQHLQVSNLVHWQQDVVNGINTPLLLTTCELPDYESLLKRVLMIMRENGLTGGVKSQVLEMVGLGLEAHLKNVVECAMDMALRGRDELVLNIEDMHNTLEMFPHLVEPCGPKIRLTAMLQNDDDAPPEAPRDELKNLLRDIISTM